MKKILLGLPILMALSCCIGLSTSPKVSDLMAEDTLAHEEIFGEVQEAGYLGVRAPRKLAFNSEFVKMGYQINYDSVKDELAIRFIAAIKDSGVKAYWHRGFAQSNGYEGANVGGTWKYKLEDNVYDYDYQEKVGLNVQSNSIYSSLTDGDSTLTAGLPATEYADYEGFIIYTLRGIPYSTYEDSYLGAYVELIDADNGENKMNSKFVAVRIEKDGFRSVSDFSFDSNTSGHFLQGTINGADNSLLRANESAGSAYWAKYEHVDLLTTDSFGSFYYSTSGTLADCHFQFFGKTSFFGDSSELLTASAELAEYNAPKVAGKYSLFVQNHTGERNHVTTFKDGSSQTYTLTNIPDWVGSGAKVFA